ncbi:MAG: tetratricopeptide repeat protein [Thermodesulfobacteriota bacterium]
MEEDTVLDTPDHPSTMKGRLRLFIIQRILFTPYNPESPRLQTGDECNFKSEDKEKSSPLGWGYTGFTLLFGVCVLILLSNCSLPKIIVLKDPLTPEEHLNLGLAYEKKGMLDHAIKEYKQAAKELPIAYLYLGNAHFLKNELSEAEAYYKKMIKKEPKNANAYNNLAWLYYTKRENLDEAENFALKAIELDPSKDNIYRDTLEKIRELKRN